MNPTVGCVGDFHGVQSLFKQYEGYRPSTFCLNSLCHSIAPRLAFKIILVPTHICVPTALGSFPLQSQDKSRLPQGALKWMQHELSGREMISLLLWRREKAKLFNTQGKCILILETHASPLRLKMKCGRRFMLGQNQPKGGVQIPTIIPVSGKAALHRRSPLPSSQAPPDWLVIGTPMDQITKAAATPWRDTPLSNSPHRPFALATEVEGCLCVQLSFPARILVGMSKRPWGRRGPQQEWPHTLNCLLSARDVEKPPESGSLESPELINLAHREAQMCKAPILLLATPATIYSVTKYSV